MWSSIVNKLQGYLKVNSYRLLLILVFKVNESWVCASIINKFIFKDRNQGKQYSQQIKDSLANLTEFVSQMENMIVERVSVIDKLECALLFYETQYGEAKIVTNVTYFIQIICWCRLIFMQNF